MKRHFGLFIVIVLLSLLLIPPLAAQENGPAQVGLRPDAPTYALHGPYWVGTMDVVIGEGTDRPLQAHIWYPALNPDGLEETITYQAVMKDPTLPADLNTIVYGHALLNAEIDASEAPYPLIVFSHGFGAPVHWYAYMLEHWASYGFIIIAPEHLENYDPNLSELWESSIERPRDISQTIDYAEMLTAAGGMMEAMINMELVAVTGQSYGGYTALAIAGARYDLAAFNARCAALPPDDLGQYMCGPLLGHDADMAALAGLDPMPEGLWPSMGDARVDVIIPMAGDSYMFDQAGLAEITIPMMAMGGTADIGTLYDWGAEPAYEYVSSAQKILVGFENADHMIFGDTCANMPYVDGDPIIYWVCMDSVWDKDRVHDLINHLSTAFLLAELYGDADAAAALSPAAAVFTGVIYEATGF